VHESGRFQAQLTNTSCDADVPGFPLLSPAENCTRLIAEKRCDGRDVEFAEPQLGVSQINGDWRRALDSRSSPTRTLLVSTTDEDRDIAIELPQEAGGPPANFTRPADYQNRRLPTSRKF